MLEPTDLVSESEIREHLKRILESDAFRDGSRSSRMLAHCVLKTLENSASDLTDVKLAEDLLSGGSRSVRQQYALLHSIARRMKQRLHAYYAAEGRQERIRIVFPPESYVPQIGAQGTASVAVDAEQPEEDTLRSPIPRRRKERVFPRFGRRFRIGIVAVGVVLLSSIAISMSWDSLRLQGTSLQYGAFHRLTSRSAMGIDPTISADGRVIVYSSDQGTLGNLALFQQLVAGEETVRLTSDDSDAHQPSISADGSMIVFRSEKDGGGISVVDSRSLAVSRIADRGRNPKVSPNGKLVAYWEFTPEPDGHDSRLYIVDIAGGPSRRLRSDFLTAQNPVWSPDGKVLLFVGRPDGSREVDWWVTPLDGSEPAATGVLTTAPHIQGLRYGASKLWSHDGKQILFDAFLGEVRSLWSVSINGKYRITREPRRVTAGVGNEALPAMSAGDRLVMSELSVEQRIWSLPLDLQGKAAGEPAAISKEKGVPEFFPTASLSAPRIAFVTERAGAPQAFIRDQATGTEQPVSSAGRAWSPLYTRENGTLAYLRLDPARRAHLLETVRPDGSKRTVACDQCDRLLSSSPGGQHLLVAIRRSDAVGPMLGDIEVATGQRRVISKDTESVSAADWSPDGKWIVYSLRAGSGRLQLKAVSAAPGGGSEISITDGSFASDNPRWSPDGKLLYYLNDSDNYRCLYAKRVSSGLAGADAFPVYHFHKARQLLLGVPPASQSLVITQNRALFTLEEVRGAIWYADPLD